MQTAKKTLLWIICTALISCLMFSCTEKDSTGPDDGSLIGTWKLTKMSLVFPGFTMDVDPVETGYLVTLTIDSDGTYRTVTTDEGVTTTTDGTWNVNDNKIQLTEEGETSEVDYTLSGDKLTFTFEEEEDGETITLIQEYTRQ